MLANIAAAMSGLGSSKGEESDRPLAHLQSAVRKVKMINAFDVFSRHDTNGTGELGRREIRQALKELGIDPDSRLARQQLKVFDADNSGTLDLDEFKNYVKSVQEAEQAFQEIDGDRMLSLFETLPCMATVSVGDRIALLRSASRQFFSVNQLCLCPSNLREQLGTFAFSPEHIYIIVSGEARLMQPMGKGSNKVALRAAGANPSERTVRAALGDPLVPVATLGPSAYLPEQLLGEARWCLQPTYGSLELLLVPKKEWAYTLGAEASRELREQVAKQSSFLVAKADRAREVLEAMSTAFPDSPVFRFTAKDGLQKRRPPQRLRPVAPLGAPTAQTYPQRSSYR